MSDMAFEGLSGGGNRRISDLSEDDRPREKAIAAGSVRGLSVAELIAIALGSGIPGRSVLEISRDIFSGVGGRLKDLGRLELDDLRNVKGIGPARAVSLLASIELGMRVARDIDSGGDVVQIRDSSTVAAVMRGRLKNLNHEEFWILFVDRQNRVISEFALSVGGMAGTVVDTKLLFKKAVLSLASGMVLVHNHPSGTTRPSIEDDNITRRIKNGCEMLDIRLLDHVIITAGEHYSYKDNGKIL